MNVGDAPTKMNALASTGAVLNPEDEDATPNATASGERTITRRQRIPDGTI